MLRRATIALALLAGLAWCGLLFGIGLDDLVDGNSKPGVVFAVVALVLLVAGFAYALWRVLVPAVVRRLVRR